VVGIKPGPIVTLYEFMPDEGTRMADVNKTVTDMTRAMATESIRIAHIPKTQLIGVEMVNLKRQTVRYRGLMEDELFVESKYKIPLALGVDIGGNPMYFDLAKMPHMLVAGRTGSGKSVFVQSIITSIVYHFTPDKCKLIIIDPKGVDFGFWDDIPHLITPIVKLEPEPAVNALKWAVREMEERYKQLQVLNARNIESYNEIAAQKRESGEKITKQVAVGTDEETGELLFETQEVDLSDMPYMVIIIDEVADLMSLARKDVEACVQRIAQKARAAGIHLVMATQRPDATTITGVIKANFPTRISFQARSRIDSVTCLGEGGAEQLLAMGDMLFSEAGRVPVRIHGAFIDDKELKRIGDFLRSQGEPEYADGVTDSAESGGGDMMGGGFGGTGDKDGDLYARAKECVLRDKKPTISYIQRRLQIGYNKAAGFMERMEADGIVSAPDANNKRHIL
jgi:S-DNA-T family DNA segregation ATPase FtsK/SpoIIIE